MPGSNASSDGFDRSPLHAKDLDGGPEGTDGPRDAGDGNAESEHRSEHPPPQDNAPPQPNMGPAASQPYTTAGKLFIGGITGDTQETDLKDYFQSFGTLTDVVVMRDKMTGRGRGFGFVTFEDASVVERILGGRHDIKGRTVDVKSAVRRGADAPDDRNKSGMGGSERIQKVFVGGLAPSVTDTIMKDYFSQFGNVTECLVMMDSHTQRSRGFGFVTFDSCDPVDDVMRRNDHSIDGKTVEIKKAFPKGTGPTKFMQQNMGGGGRMGGGGGGGGGYGGRGGDWGGGGGGMGSLSRGGGYGNQGGGDGSMDPRMVQQMYQMMMMAGGMGGAGGAGGGGGGGDYYGGGGDRSGRDRYSSAYGGGAGAGAGAGAGTGTGGDAYTQQWAEWYRSQNAGYDAQGGSGFDASNYAGYDSRQMFGGGYGGGYDNAYGAAQTQQDYYSQQGSVSTDGSGGPNRGGGQAAPRYHPYGR